MSTAANHGRLWLFVAALLAASGRRAGRRAAVRGLFALSCASAVANIPAKLATARDRPDIALVPQARHLARLPTSTSFPSGHAASAAAFATGVAIEAPRVAPFVGVLAGAVAYSRVHTGVHYPLDVLGGVAVGFGAAAATRRWWPPASPWPAAMRTTSEGPVRACPAGAGLVVVVNAKAGGADDHTVRELRALLPDADVRPVDHPDDLPDALRAAAGSAQVLGVAGGDGSVNAAAAIAREAGLPLAVFPAGTLNRFAAELGIEALADAARAVTGGKTLLVDLAMIGEHPFLNVASFGGYAQLVAARERLQDRIGKWPAVAVGVWRVLRRGDPVDVLIDGSPRRLWLAFVSNCRYEPSGFAPARRPRLDDGVLDIRLVDAARPFSRARLLGALLTGRVGASPLYEERSAVEVTIASRRGRLRLTRDGEVFEDSGTIVVRKHPQALAVLVPDLTPAAAPAFIPR